jgi:TonB family protein
MYVVRYIRVLVAFGLLTPALYGADEPKTVLVSPGVLHGLAYSSPLPNYPVSSLKANHTGVAVIAVVIGESGKVEKTTMLQAPDQSAARSVDDAVKEWKFHPFLANGSPVSMKGRLIFYFRFLDGKPVVTDATASPPPK